MVVRSCNVYICPEKLSKQDKYFDENTPQSFTVLAMTKLKEIDFFHAIITWTIKKTIIHVRGWN